MEEIFKPVPTRNNIYFVSNKGSVKSIDRVNRYNPFGRKVSRKIKGKTLVASVSRNGYKKVSLTNGKRRQQLFIHYLVLRTFVGKRPKGYEVCHNNGIKTDNRRVNLRYDTNSNNKLDRAKHITNNKKK